MILGFRFIAIRFHRFLGSQNWSWVRFCNVLELLYLILKPRGHFSRSYSRFSFDSILTNTVWLSGWGCLFELALVYVTDSIGLTGYKTCGHIIRFMVRLVFQGFCQPTRRCTLRVKISSCLHLCLHCLVRFSSVQLTDRTLVCSHLSCHLATLPN